MAVASAAGALGGTFASRIALAAAGDPSSLTFTPLAQVIKEDHQVAPGYTAKVLIRWGDRVLPETPPWDPMSQSASANGARSVVPESEYARRITVDTEMAIAGPAAGLERLKTSYDPTGTRVLGTVNNCAGGKTPWGTVLMAEENFHGYFGGVLPGSAQRKNNIPDGMYACDVAGDGRAYVKFFYACPVDAEMCGPEFTPDGRTLFVAPQHPGEAEESTLTILRPASRTSRKACRRDRRWW